MEFEEIFEQANKQNRLTTRQALIVDDNVIEVTTTGHDYDAIAVVLNKTGYHIVINFFDYEENITIKPYEHCLLLMNVEGRAQLVQFLYRNYTIYFDEPE